MRLQRQQARARTLVEQLRLEENLSVRDGNHVRRDVRGHVVRHRLDDGQRRHRAAAELVGQLRSALEEARVQVEDVTGVRLTARGATEQQRHLTVGDGLLGEVVVADDGVGAVVAEVLAHGCTRVRCEVLR